MMRYRVICILALATGCATPATPSPLQTMGTAPVKLRYRGAHRGAHPSWVYVTHVEIRRGNGGDRAWQQLMRVEHVSGAQAPRSVEALGFVARELDQLVLTVPLAVGYKGEIELADAAGKARPFALEVQQEERVRVPAGEFTALRVAITPRDGDPRFSATYHVQSAAPRIVLRKEYVVNPAIAGAASWSLGTEELDAMDGVASAYPAK